MMKRKLFLVFGILLSLSWMQTIKAQSSNVIILNEYSASNTTGPVDNFGVYSDWVEILNIHTSPVSLNGYYLSNDRNNLYKWKFPASFGLAVGEMKVVWLSGKNVNNGVSYHANFTLDQGKGQWLILTTSAGVVRDSVYVQPTKAGHTRGRIDPVSMGINAWRLYPTHSWMLPNPGVGYFIDYLPKPTFVASTPGSTLAPINSTGAINPGAFLPGGGSTIFQIKINGFPYDTITFPCFDVFYTTNGDYPSRANGTRYVDSVQTVITLGKTSVLRAVTVPALTNTAVSCQLTDYADSFCESNTYFIDQPHQEFDDRFAVVSLAIDNLSNDTAWFNSQGSPPSTTVHVEYYDKKKQVCEGYAILNRPYNETWATTQKGYYISIDDRYGFGSSFNGPIFNSSELGTSSRTVFPTLHMKAGGIESCSPYATAANTDDVAGTGLRDVFYQSLALKYKLNVNPLHVKPVIAFVNGSYWGVYNLTELFDKYYENYYHGQSKDSLDMCFYNNGDASVSYPDGSVSTFNNDFKSAVYNKSLAPLRGATNSNYLALFSKLDKESFKDYMILQSFAMNSELWNFNIAFAKGGQSGKEGSKWHYYLWNMPAIFNYSAITTNTLPPYFNSAVSPCYIQSIAGYVISPKAHNAHGAIFNSLMNGNTSNLEFRAEYINRYMDLLNGPLSCKALDDHWTLVDSLYKFEMRKHEDPGLAGGSGKFFSKQGRYDTAMAIFHRKLKGRCSYMETAFNRPGGCYSIQGPYDIAVDVTPVGGGHVKINTVTPDSYPWSGKYFQSKMTFSATPTNTNYVFHHWEFTKHTPNQPVSQSSVDVDIAGPDQVLAVFTDITNPIANVGDGTNIPSGFTPNGDNLNETFRPLGSAEYTTEFQMTIWSRWGEEVYRSTDPTGSGWDGNYKGTQAPTGVYAYVITYKNVYGESKMIKGNVTLTR